MRVEENSAAVPGNFAGGPTGRRFPGHFGRARRGAPAAPSSTSAARGAEAAGGAAIKISGSAPDKTVLISGIGGLGHMALQYARVTGARTIAVDVTEEKLELAKRLGADEVINARSADVAEAAQRLGGADVVIGTAVSAQSFAGAFGALRRGGKMVLVGLPPESLPVPVFDLVLKGVSVIGSIVGTRRDLQETLELAARGLVRCSHTTARMEEINDVFDEMRAGRIDGRVVLQVR